MKDIIKLENGQEITLDNNLAWLMEYQDQFGEDILPTIMPLILSVGDLIAGLAETEADLEKFDLKDLVALFKTEAALDAGIKLSTFRTVDVINIIWAMAKAADDTIDPPRKWIRQFEGGFPVDIILPKAARLVVKGVLSQKNAERLSANMKKLQPKKTKKKTARSN